MIAEPQSTTPNPGFPDLTLLRQEFRRLRRERNITQTDIGKRMGVTQATVSALENGKYQSINKKMLANISAIVKEWRTSATIKALDAGWEQSLSQHTHDDKIENSEITEVRHEKQDILATQDMRDALVNFLGGDAVCRALIKRLKKKELTSMYLKMLLLTGQN